MLPTNPSQFSLWSYLTQPIGTPGYPFILNPTQFWNKQKVSFIERCWVTSYASEEQYHEEV